MQPRELASCYRGAAPSADPVACLFLSLLNGAYWRAVRRNSADSVFTVVDTLSEEHVYAPATLEAINVVRSQPAPPIAGGLGGV